MASENGSPELPPLNAMCSSVPTTIFSVMSALAVQHKSVNLGQGFPDDEGPASMKEAAARALQEQSQQYPSLLGDADLRAALAEHSARHQGLPVDPAGGVLVTAGAQEGIALAFMALCNPGDEVIVFEPLYDSYVGMCAAVGARLVAVQLQPPGWDIPAAQLEAAFSPATKFVLVNTPHNPTGKVFSRPELQLVADLAARHNTYVVCDEVYEHLVFEGAQHVSLRALPGMAERAVRLGSAGKTFSFTGWKVGWVTGPARLLSVMTKAHQFVVFTVPPNLQQAVAYGLQHERPFYEGLGPRLQRKRALLEPRLAALGFRVLPAQGTYFLVADAAAYMGPDEDDVAFCKRLTSEGGVTLIPVSAFYASAAGRPRSLVRFAFCKRDEVLAAACERLEAYLGGAAAAAGGGGAAAAAAAAAAGAGG